MKEQLVGLSFEIPNGSKDAIRTIAIDNLTGDANISVSRGKRRRLLDVSFDVEFEGSVGGTVGKGKLCFTEVAFGETPVVKMDVNSDASPALREVFNALVKNTGHGLQPLVTQAVEAILAEYNEL